MTRTRLVTEEASVATPGEHLRAEIERLGVDQTVLAEAIGVSRQTVNNIVNGRQAISRAMAAKLGRFIGRASDYGLRQTFPPDAGGRRRNENDAWRFHGGVLIDREIIRAVQDGVIGIDPFDAANVRAASIELTLGATFTRRGRSVDIGDDGLAIRPGASVRIATRERVELPADCIGRAGIAPGLAAKGLLIASAFQIEPKFRGRIEAYVFHAGGEIANLGAGAPVMTLKFLRLNPAPNGI